MTTSTPGGRDPFGASGGGWRAVSPRLATVRRISVVTPIALVTAIAAGVSAVAGEPWMVLASGAAGGLVVAWLWWVIGRQVRAIGYALRGDDLAVVSGVLFRRMVVVPYGRMQLVDVTRGPIDRRFDLAAVQLHTAAATTDASVPGLAPSEATELRDRLASLGEQRSAGL